MRLPFRGKETGALTAFQAPIEEQVHDELQQPLAFMAASSVGFLAVGGALSIIEHTRTEGAIPLAIGVLLGIGAAAIHQFRDEQ